MREQRRNESRPGPALTVHELELTVEQALAMRDEQAKLAGHYADRVERAQAAGQYGVMRSWMLEYRRAAMQCRLLGERIRREQNLPEQSLSEQTGPSGPSVVARIAPRPRADLPPAGEAA